MCLSRCTSRELSWHLSTSPSQGKYTSLIASSHVQAQIKFDPEAYNRNPHTTTRRQCKLSLKQLPNHNGLKSSAEVSSPAPTRRRNIPERSQPACSPVDPSLLPAYDYAFHIQPSRVTLSSVLTVTIHKIPKRKHLRQALSLLDSIQTSTTLPARTIAAAGPRNPTYTSAMAMNGARSQSRCQRAKVPTPSSQTTPTLHLFARSTWHSHLGFCPM